MKTVREIVILQLQITTTINYSGLLIRNHESQKTMKLRLYERKFFRKKGYGNR